MTSFEKGKMPKLYKIILLTISCIWYSLVILTISFLDNYLSDFVLLFQYYISAGSLLMWVNHKQQRIKLIIFLDIVLHLNTSCD